MVDTRSNPAPYPRVYRASGGWLIGLTVCGVALSAGGTLGAWFLAHESFRNPQSRFLIVGLCLALTLLGIYCLLSTFRSKILLFPDRIEVVELTHTTVMSREEIRGWRSLPTSPPGLLLEHRDASRRKVKIARIFKEDSEFSAWIYTLPSLDSEDARASKAEVRNDLRLGATPGERMKSLAKGRRFAHRLTIITTLAILWGLIPIPYPLAILALFGLPWIAVLIVKRSGGLFRVDARRNDVHPSVGVPFIFPGFILLLRATNDYNVIGSSTLALVTIGIAGILCYSAVAVDATLGGKTGTIALLFLLSLAYGYGATVEVNSLFDRSPATTYRVRVEGKHVVTGKSTSYVLDLEPWGPKMKSNRLRVARATYDPIQRGNVVILVLRRGALGVNWFFMRAWERGGRLANGGAD